MELKLGSNDQNTNGEVTYFQQWFQRFARSYAPPVDGYIGNADVAAISLLQSKLGIIVDGRFGDRTASAARYKWKGTNTPPVVTTRRPIWIYTGPGSGAPGDVGPSFQLGEWARKVLNLNHQWINSPIGGYLGFMGGDPKYSYREVNEMFGIELERLLALNPDVQRAMDARRMDAHAKVDVELWFSAYSQKAEGIEDAVERLFGDGGKYAMIRDRINGLVQYGNPSTKETGIANKTRPNWLYALVTNINYDNDFYAIAPDEIRRNFYAIIVQAEMELPFFVHVLRVAIPVMLGFIAPIGGLFGPLGALMVAGMTGLNGALPLLGGLMGQASAADEEVDRKLIEMLTLTGLIKNVGGMIKLVGALPGLQAHGGYEFDPVMMDRARNVLAAFRR